MERKSGYLISQIKHMSDRALERVLSQKNIDAFNGAQGRLLYVLWQKDEISLKTLSDETRLAPTTLTSMIDRMEAQGLVNRIADKNDRRKTLIVLTQKAKALKKDYDDVSKQMTMSFYNGFSESEIEQCEQMLERIRDNMSKTLENLNSNH